MNRIDCMRGKSLIQILALRGVRRDAAYSRQGQRQRQSRVAFVSSRHLCIYLQIQTLHKSPGHRHTDDGGRKCSLHICVEYTNRYLTESIFLCKKYIPINPHTMNNIPHHLILHRTDKYAHSMKDTSPPEPNKPRSLRPIRDRRNPSFHNRSMTGHIHLRYIHRLFSHLTSNPCSACSTTSPKRPSY